METIHLDTLFKEQTSKIANQIKWLETIAALPPVIVKELGVLTLKRVVTVCLAILQNELKNIKTASLENPLLVLHIL